MYRMTSFCLSLVVRHVVIVKLPERNMLVYMRSKLQRSLEQRPPFGMKSLSLDSHALVVFKYNRICGPVLLESVFFQGHNGPAILRLSKTYSTMTLSMSNLACGMVGIMWDLRSSH